MAFKITKTNFDDRLQHKRYQHNDLPAISTQLIVVEINMASQGLMSK